MEFNLSVAIARMIDAMPPYMRLGLNDPSPRRNGSVKSEIVDKLSEVLCKVAIDGPEDCNDLDKLVEIIRTMSRT